MFATRQTMGVILGRGWITASVFFALSIPAYAQVVDRSGPVDTPVAPLAEGDAATDLTIPNQPPPDGLAPRGGVPQRVEADISVAGATSDFVALILDSDGMDNLYIKVQRNATSGSFDNVGFYHGVNVGGWPGQSGG